MVYGKIKSNSEALDYMSNSFLHVNILTIYPEMFPGSLNFGVVGNALNNNIWSLNVIDIKKFGFGKHKNIDEKPVGGGPGMIMRSDVIDDAIRYAQSNMNVNIPLIYLTPKGKPLSQDISKKLSKYKKVNILCGRFGGVDERIILHYKPLELSLGDFILSGAEIAAQALIDSVVRLLPGTLGNKNSTNNETFSGNLFEYPQFTKPNIWNGYEIPNVLLSGDHKAIKLWRHNQSKIITKERRSDLWKKFLNSDIDAFDK